MIRCLYLNPTLGVSAKTLGVDNCYLTVLVDYATATAPQRAKFFIVYFYELPIRVESFLQGTP